MRSPFHEWHFDFWDTLVVIITTAIWSQMTTVQVIPLFEQLCMSKVAVQEQDDLFNSFLAWTRRQKWFKDCRNVSASTPLPSEGQQILRENVTDIRELLKVKPLGELRFKHKGRSFLIRLLISNEDRQTLELLCFGRTPDPCIELLEATKGYSNHRGPSRIRLFCPASCLPKRWKEDGTIPRRPIESVILEEETKSCLLEDLRSFLQTSSVARYSRRSIPYRRGYLLYGLPGTGKTSLVIGLAGFFNLPLCILSLSDKRMTEDDVIDLMSNLPYHSIFLLEDVDCVGATREDDTPGGPPKRRGQGDRISLSCLLNAIDGVRSSEGRVLIMTTNHRKELDEAITRPGRIDREFEFTLASRSQAEGIFTWNFGRVNGELQGAGDELDRPVEAISQTNEDVSKLAKRFGDVLLDKELPPAAIQTFLMSYDDPNKALAETPDWLCEVGKKAQAKVDHKNSARSDSARMEESRI